MPLYIHGGLTVPAATPEEQRWVEQLQRVLSLCPERLEIVPTDDGRLLVTDREGAKRIRTVGLARSPNTWTCTCRPAPTRVTLCDDLSKVVVALVAGPPLVPGLSGAT